jgi:putative oxidoreductase
MKPSALDIGWTLVRVVFGFGLAYFHGVPKVFGGKMVAFTHSVASLGFPFPTFFAWSAALSELVGGTLVMLGLFTRPAAAVAGFTMLVALHRLQNEPFARSELAMMYFSVMCFATLIGSGRFGLDRKVHIN